MVTPKDQNIGAKICHTAMCLGVAFVRLVASFAVLTTDNQNLCNHNISNIIYHSYLAIGAASILFCFHQIAFNSYNLAILIMVSSLYNRIPCDNQTWSNYILTEIIASSTLIIIQVVIEFHRFRNRRCQRQPPLLVTLDGNPTNYVQL